MSKPTPHILIFRSVSDVYSATIETHPEQTSDYRDALGRPLTLLACVPIGHAVAASALRDAVAALLATTGLNEDDNHVEDREALDKGHAALALANSLPTAKALVRIEVRGGIAEVVESPAGIDVQITDFDVQVLGEAIRDH